MLAAVVVLLAPSVAGAAVFPSNTTLLDDFNRANTASVGGQTSTSGDVWGATPIDTGGGTQLGISANRGYGSGGANNAYLQTITTADADVHVDVPVLPGNGQWLALFARAVTPGASGDYYGLVYTQNASNVTWELRRYVNTTPTTLATLTTASITAGDRIGLRVEGTGAIVNLTAYRYNGGAWSQILNASDASPSRLVAPGYVAVEVSSGAGRIDNFSGGVADLAPVVGSGTVLGTDGCTSTDSLLLTPPIGGGTARTQQDCTLAFGAPGGKASLHLTQSDASGSAMYGATRGALDTNLTGDGLLDVDQSPGNDRGSAVAVRPDGRLVTLIARGTGTAMVVRQFNADGTPDTSFGTTPGETVVPGTSDARDLELLDDGSVVVVGAWGADAQVAKLTSTGQLDTTFSGDGVATATLSTPLGIGVDAHALTVGADGEIYVAAESPAAHGAADEDLVVLNFTADGRLDPTFDGDGIVNVDVAGDEEGRDVVVQRDGRIVVVGWSNTGNADVLLVRLRTNGQLDTTFGGTGIRTIPVGAGADNGRSVQQRASGELVVSGFADVGGSDDAFALQVTAAGVLDTNFSGDGITTFPSPGVVERAYSADLQPDGSLVMAGTRDIADDELLLLRVDSTGNADTSFGSSGVVSTQGGATSEELRKVVAGPDGWVYAAGATTVGSNDVALFVGLRGTRIADYSTGTADFTTGTNAFGACLRAVGGSAQTSASTWSVDATCPLTTGAWWHGLPTATGATSQVAATSTVGAVDATASLRFGAKVAGSEAAGAYRAPITVTVMSPNLEPPVNTAVPTISGTAQVRRTLTAANGTWTGSDPITYTYQWQRCTPGCADISGATAATYNPVVGDVGATIRVRVTGTNGLGSATGTSAQTGTVTAAATSSIFYATGFEHQEMLNGGGGVRTAFSGGGTDAATTAVKRYGNAALRVTTTAGNNGQWDVNFPAGTYRTASARVNFALEQVPSVINTLTQLDANDTYYCEVGVDPIDADSAQMYATINTSSTSSGRQYGPVVRVNEWHRIDFSCDVSTTVAHELQWSIDGVAQNTVSWAGQAIQAFASDGFQIGIDSNDTARVLFDDVSASTTKADYPIGAGKVAGLVPNATATHTSPGNYGYSLDNGGTFPGGQTLSAADNLQTPGSAQYVDEWPINTSGTGDVIRQTNTTGRLEYELTNPTPTDPVNAVSVLAAGRRAAGGASNLTIAANGGAGFANALSVTPITAPSYGVYRGVLTSVPVSGAAWTAAAVTGLRLGIASTDVTQRPWTDALMAEVDFVAGAAPTNLAVPIVSGGATVGETLTTTTGTWTPLTGATFDYRWQRCTAAGACTDISGATSASYVLQAADSGNYVRAVVTATNSEGAQSATSSRTSAVSQLPTLVQLDGFEAGQVLSSGTMYASVMTAGGTVAADSTWARNGGWSLRVANAGSAANTGVQYGGGSGTAGVVRVALRLENLPLAYTELLEVTTADSTSCELRFDATSGRFTAAVQGGTAQSGPLVEAGRWYLIDLRCNVATGTRRVDWQVDGVAMTQATRAVAASTVSGLTLGNTGAGSSSGYTASYDDLATSNTTGDYPIGFGAIDPLAATQVGTHGTIANFQQSSNGGGTWTAFAAENDALPGTAALLSDLPTQFTAGTVGTMVQQTTAASYLEYRLADDDRTQAPSSIRGVGIHSAQTSTVQNAQLVAERSGSTTALYTNDPAGANALNGAQAVMNTRPGGGAWTAADVDLLRLRISSSNVGTAANERPRTHDVLAEAAFPADAHPVAAGAPTIQQPWSTVKVGDELRARRGTWGAAPVDRGWQWLRCASTGLACAPISGATSVTYVLQAGDAGSVVRVADLARNAGGWQTKLSAATRLVATQPSFVGLNGFEAGTVSANVTNDGFSSLNAVTYSGAQVHSGASAMNAPAAATFRGAVYTPTAGTRTTVQRMYVRFAAWPSTTMSILNVSLGSGASCDMDLISGNGSTQIEWSDGGGFGNVVGPRLSLNRWYLFDLRADTTTTTWRCDLAIDGVPLATSVRSGAASAVDQTQLNIGHMGGSVAALYLDDWAISTTATDYPIGGGHVEALRPSDAGVHTSTSYFGSDAGGLGTDPQLRLDEGPAWSITDWVSQTTIGATERLEWQMSDPTERGRAARAVRGVIGYSASSTATNHGITKVVRSADTDAAAPVVYNGDMGFNTMRWAGAVVPAPSGGWTIQALDALRMRTGYSTDVTPNPRWEALALEVEYRD